MAVWFILAAMTGAAVLALLWPLSRRPQAADGAAGETAFYEDQLREIDRDAARGLIGADEAEAARAEAGRRLLRACRVPASRLARAEAEPALRRRRAAAAFSLSTVPLAALVVYGVYGSPELPGKPAASRVADARALDIDAAVARIEAHLEREPGDGRGWELLAPIYLRGGRFSEAAAASGRAMQILGETPVRLADHAEALVAAGDGLVSAEARANLERALALDAAAPKARFYLARAAEQDGDRTLAKERYAALAADAPESAPWLPIVRERLAALGEAPPSSPSSPPSPAARGPASPAGAAVAALPEADRSRAIRGMVEGLDGRLARQGGSAEEWARLVRAYGVLGEPARAEAALARARTALASDPSGLDSLNQVAREIAAPASLAVGARP